MMKPVLMAGKKLTEYLRFNYPTDYAAFDAAKHLESDSQMLEQELAIYKQNNEALKAGWEICEQERDKYKADFERLCTAQVIVDRDVWKKACELVYESYKNINIEINCPIWRRLDSFVNEAKQAMEEQGKE